ARSASRHRTRRRTSDARTPGPPRGARTPRCPTTSQTAFDDPPPLRTPGRGRPRHRAPSTARRDALLPQLSRRITTSKPPSRRAAPVAARYPPPPDGSERAADQNELRILPHRPLLEAELLREREHVRVLPEHDPVHALEAPLARDVDEVSEQPRRDAAPLPSIVDDDRELAAPPVGLGDIAGDADLAGCAVDVRERDQRHLAVVVDLRE